MTKKEAVKYIKLFFIAFACCIPLFVVIGIFLTQYIGNVWSVVIYIVIGAGAFVLAIYLDKKHEEKLALKREKSKLARRYRQSSNEKNEKTN